MASTDTTSRPQERDKALSLFTYLKELCALRTTQVRNVSSYDQTFWLNDLPRHKLCRSALWRLVDPQPAITEIPADLWIEVRKPALESPPEPPDDVEPWLKYDDLENSSLAEPAFHDQIPLSAIQSDPNVDDQSALVSINDYPDVFDKLVEYIGKRWKPWAEKDRELQAVLCAYNQLFNIYQRQEKLGEQYEVIMGVGLLSWRSPSSGDIRRHVLAIQARIEFDRVRGVITAGPSLDGPRPTLEYGMLETADRPNPSDLTKIEEDVETLDGDPLETIGLESILKGFAHSLPSAGYYASAFEQVSTSSDRPRINLAPALILRKRSRRTFEDFYRQILEQVEQGEEIPENVRRIIEIVDDDPDESDDYKAPPSEAGNASTDGELYFPLPANQEQRRIVFKAEKRRGVLVQGPPGTGKSHTIANLISHYLATGKRVLVTSETPRALEVLRSKLPQEIQELCVVWLGSGPESHKALERSVQGITQRKANWNAGAEHSSIDKYASMLDSARKTLARLRHDLTACREADIYQHTNIFERYSGTLQSIAIDINHERDKFQWFIDRPEEAEELQLHNEELLEMIRIHRRLTTELISQLKLQLFPLEELMPPPEFRRLVEAEERARNLYTEAEERRNYPGYSHLAALERPARDTIKLTTDEILAIQVSLSKHFHHWAERASREIAGDQDRIWRHVLSTTMEHIERIEDILAEHGELDVKGLSLSDYRQVKDDVSALIDHLEAGRGLGFWLFRGTVVKQASYIIENVSVNGRDCTTTGTLHQLRDWVEATSRIASLHELWKEITSPPTGSATLQCSAYRDLCEPIEEALSLHDRIEIIKTLCRDRPGVRLPSWHSQDEVCAFGMALDAVNIEEGLMSAQRAFPPLTEALKEYIHRGSCHPTTQELMHAVTTRNAEAYQNACDTVSTLHDWASALGRARSIHARFRSCAPQTCATYDDTYTESCWDERLRQFSTAWAWAKADCWLDKMRASDRLQQIQDELESAATQERNALGKLASAKAWQYCMSHLREKERMALMAWSLAVAKIRGGTGRYAETHRETARQKLDECRRAIPAWVMPLYQVVQTIRPQLHQFDVVIIDEASQSGPEALLLNYIADKLIVVGDDKQITPMHVGVERTSVEFLKRKHLQNIPHPEALDLEGSLFSQAELRFPDRIRLREHFRCMPEIIQFSNNLSYSTEPLIPLRQYGADRLEPVKTVFVKDGYRKGQSEHIENEPEARAIVAHIAECCETPHYAGKTFGVISLMGARQAELINTLLLGADGIGAEEMERRQIVCGRPYDFQGDERDVIFLSMVDAPQDGQPLRMIRDPDTQRRFNVAASRARDQLWLFHSATINDLKPECLRYRLLSYCLHPAVHNYQHELDADLIETHRRTGMPPQPFDSWFEVDVFVEIQSRDYRVLPQYEVAGYRIDLVVEGMQGRLAVECDGDNWHGPDRYEADMARQRDLERCGWRFWRVRGCEFYRDRETSLKELWSTLESLRILPCHLWEEERRAHEARAPSERAEASVSSPSHDDDARSVESDIREPHAQNQTLELRHKLDDISPQEIQHAILGVLASCPNNSCTVKSLTSRVLKKLGVITRGNPRSEFERRVMRNLGTLSNKCLVEEYKAKNRRIRLPSAAHESLF